MGPKIQRNTNGAKSQNRTYPDLLTDAFDEALFEHYCTSEASRATLKRLREGGGREAGRGELGGEDGERMQ